MKYEKTKRYTMNKNIDNNSDGHAGPGGLQLAEFLAEKMAIKSNKKLIDIGFHRGHQTCFLAKEYGVSIVGIDPGGTIGGDDYGIEPLMENARKIGVEDKILGIEVGVPNTLLPNNYFDYAYVTTCLEMIRQYQGFEGYIAALKEIRRIIKGGAILGLAEPMCMDMPIPDCCKKHNFDKCFVTAEVTRKAVSDAGFTIIESGYCEDSGEWWLEHGATSDDPNYQKDIELMVDSGWLSFGYVLASK